MLCDDRSEYWVKFPEHGSRALFNEGLGAEICNRLNLPTAEAAIVTLTELFIRDSAGLTSRGIQPGSYFGTRQVTSAFDFTEPASVGIKPWDIANREEVAKILGFDNWVRNMDRGGGNLLISKVETAEGPRYRMLMIDNGFILTGPSWHSANLAAVAASKDLVPRFDFLNRCVWSLEEFGPFCDSLEAMPAEAPGGIVDDIPIAWLEDQVERAAAVRFLEDRKALVRSALQAFALNPERPPP